MPFFYLGVELAGLILAPKQTYNLLKAQKRRLKLSS